MNIKNIIIDYKNLKKNLQQYRIEKNIGKIVTLVYDTDGHIKSKTGELQIRMNIVDKKYCSHVRVIGDGSCGFLPLAGSQHTEVVELRNDKNKVFYKMKKS